MSRLVLTRREGETVVIAGVVRVTVHQIKHGKTCLAIDAPEHVAVDREEIHLRRQANFGADERGPLVHPAATG